MNIDNELAAKQNTEEPTTLLEEHHEEADSIDFSKYSKSDLLNLLQNIKVEEGLGKAQNLSRNIKLHYDNILESEKSTALSSFIESGGSAEDFEYKKDETSLKIEKGLDQIREKINQINSQNEREKEVNLVQKNVILDKIRSLISLEETTTSINTLKELQAEWKKIGPVPAAYNQELWANYNALIDRFYNNRSIYFELKELDRKKNLEAKVELVEKAEKLIDLDSPTQSIKELKTLHEEFKHIGPVPKEEQEALWNRFKIASDRVYEKRNQQFEKIKQEQEVNYHKKLELVTRLEEFSQFTSERIDDWKSKTSEVLALQEEWKKVGLVPLEKSKEVSKKFWTACKSYFQNKDAFFKTLEQKKEQNLQLKLELIVQAEQLKDSTDYASTANTLKELQKMWDSIGPVPIKQKEVIFKRFKEACDVFFKHKREHAAETEKQYVENLHKKEHICEEIDKLSKEKNKDTELLKSLQSEWKSIGFVPRNEMKNIQEKYNNAIQNYIQSLDGSVPGSSKENFKLSLEISALRNSPDSGRKIHKKENEVYKKINTLKSEIDRYRTNIDFFARSKNADLLKKDIEEKIAAATKEIKELEEQLKIIRQA